MGCVKQGVPNVLMVSLLTKNTMSDQKSRMRMTTHVSSGRAQGRVERNAARLGIFVALDRERFAYDILTLGSRVLCCPDLELQYDGLM
jgi:hypothetical protein